MFFCSIRLIPEIEMLTVTGFSVTARKYHLVRQWVSPQPYGKKVCKVQDEIHDRIQKKTQLHAF